MSKRALLTDWSQEYVEAFYDQAPNDSIIGKFALHDEREGFIASIRARRAAEPERFAGVEITSAKDGLGVSVRATRESLMELVEAAKRFNGKLLFPGTR